MSDRAAAIDVDVRAWVESAVHDPVLYRDRQVSEIVLTAIGLAPRLSETLVLKGGALMALAFGSLRVTGDLDFTAEADPDGFDEALVEELNVLLPRTAIRLGYLDLRCRVQSVKKKPRAENFTGQSFPSIEVKIGWALRGSPQEPAYGRGQAPRVVQVDISFRDPVFSSQSLHLSLADADLRAFTVHEVIAEKLRALLQQPLRNRFRRQDVYDIAFLLDGWKPEGADLGLIHRILEEKCATRDIHPDAASLDNPEVAARAKADWDSLRLELADLPPFEDRFDVVHRLYLSLPWTKA